ISAATVVFYVALMFYYDVVLTLVALAIAGLNLVALHYVSRKRSEENQKLLNEKGKLMGTSMRGLLMIETLKASGSESDWFTRWSGFHAKTVNARQNLGVPTQILTSVPPFLMAV